MQHCCFAECLVILEAGEVVGRHMKRKTTPTGAVSRQLDLLKTREDELRGKRITVLRRELEKTCQRARSLERELRLLGDQEAMRAAGKIRWDDVYEQLGRTFTAREMQELTGATPNLVGSIVFRWKEQGRITGTGERGEYRKSQTDQSRKPRRQG